MTTQHPDLTEQLAAILAAVATALAAGQRSYDLYGTTFPIPVEIDAGRVTLAQRRLAAGVITETLRLLAQAHQITLP